MWKSCSALILIPVAPAYPSRAVSEFHACCIYIFLGICFNVVLSLCVLLCVCVCVCKLYQTLQSIGLRFIRYLRVRVRATCATHAWLINTTTTHPAWPQHFVTINPCTAFFFRLYPPSPPLLHKSLEEVMDSRGSTLWDLNTFNVPRDSALMANAQECDCCSCLKGDVLRVEFCVRKKFQ